MQRFTELHVWQKGHELALRIYRISAAFPSAERYGLTSQLRRAATSVPTNIAEGSKRRSRQEYARFLNTAEASLAEVEYLLMLARDLDYLKPPIVAEDLARADELAKMLNGLPKKVEGSPSKT